MIKLSEERMRNIYGGNDNESENINISSPQIQETETEIENGTPPIQGVETGNGTPPAIERRVRRRLGERQILMPIAREAHGELALYRIEATRRLETGILPRTVNVEEVINIGRKRVYAKILDI